MPRMVREGSKNSEALVEFEKRADEHFDFRLPYPTSSFLSLILIPRATMNYIDTHYYQLNRKLLITIGQWPYQSLTEKLKIWFLYFCILLPAGAAQVAKVVTTELDFDLFVELLSDQLTGALAVVRSFIFTLNNRKVKGLLHNMELNWQSLANDDENVIFGNTAEEGRLYALHYILFIYTFIISGLVLALLPPFLMYINLLNDSYPRLLLFPGEYFINEQKYYFFIVTHASLVFVVLMTWVMASDTFLMIFMYHCVGMFKIVCYRLEHAFDICNDEIMCASDRTNVCRRIASAVEFHRNAIRFCDAIVTTFEWSNLISLLLVLINVTVSFYWAVVSKGQGFKMIVGMLFGIGQLAHMFSLDIPAQQITDYSKEVTFKAYSSLWYTGRPKEQALLLLTMQRGLKPSAMMIGKIYPMTLENYATEVNASFSYVTMLLSVN